MFCFLQFFNNLLAFLATAAKAQLSGRVHHHVYHRVNCPVKILNANLPHLNERNSENTQQNFPHMCISMAPFTFLLAHINAKIAMFYFSPHLLHCLLFSPVCITLQASYSMLRTALCARPSASALSRAGKTTKPTNALLATHRRVLPRIQSISSAPLEEVS